jgi:hypothetical protein
MNDPEASMSDVPANTNLVARIKALEAAGIATKNRDKGSGANEISCRSGDPLRELGPG